jgi:hypothetical protein
VKRSAALVLLIWAATTLTALAQTPLAQTPGNPASLELFSQAFDPTSPAFEPPGGEHLLGDWGGLRTTLNNDGIYIQFGAITEFAGNTGGAQQGATSANQIAFPPTSACLATAASMFRCRPVSSRILAATRCRGIT